jgi:hypothetical protein
MKIRIPAQTVEVDPEAWALSFDIDPQNVRRDVQAYFDGWFQAQVDELGLQPKKQESRD